MHLIPLAEKASIAVIIIRSLNSALCEKSFSCSIITVIANYLLDSLFNLLFGYEKYGKDK
ncbi:hypothetical protein JCM6292_1957 [Bacteroides pyogenes JCM 6292]|uniref:Uncharacterized protein n=2 Tax=Bacteroides pyogenes TaxID=310300 RepID=W4PKB7_9BACE|nr:hypothetical protein JCM6292_1957 [Bacteroides pyogenes JCM 6292]GAE19544.1 hypothetical protein JCM6294_2610 [Bacteroides pyogenes DSM 20611 = JCM 6294]